MLACWRIPWLLIVTVHWAVTTCRAAHPLLGNDTCYLLDPSCDPDAHYFSDEHYNRYRPPSMYTDAEGDPTVIYFQFFIESTFDVCPVNQQLSFTGQLEYSWLDARLNLTRLLPTGAGLQQAAELPERLAGRLWKPRLAFSPVTRLRPLDSHADSRLRLSVASDRRIVASQRVQFALCCNVDFTYFPFDVHVCDMSIVNVESDDHQSILRWIGDDQSPFRVSENSIHFHAKHFTEGTFHFFGLLPLFVVDDLPSGKRRTRLVVRAAFRRQLLAVLMDPLGPSVLPVFLSWLSFWLDPQRPVPRAAVMALALVLLEHQQASHMATRAQDYHVRSIDVWYLVCRCFVLAALLQYVFILATADTSNASSASPATPSSPPYVDGAGAVASGPSTGPASPMAGIGAAVALTRVVRLSPYETDDACKTLFPLAFLLAALLYAGTYAWPLLTSKDLAKLPIRWAE